MGKLFNKIVRKATAIASGNELAQVQSGTVLGGKANEPLANLMRKAGADGCVLLKNENNILPLKNEDNTAFFGRVHYDWFFVGDGSGGDVCTPYKKSLYDALVSREELNYNKEVAQKYKKWCTEKINVPDPGYWAHWPRYYSEMPLDNSFVANAAKCSKKAVVVIGRSAGEDRENALIEGSYYLTKKEIKMLDTVTANFDDVVLLLNIGSIIDFKKIDEYSSKIKSIMIVWQDGMESGNSVLDVLFGKVNPSGHLSDTIARQYSDYPSANDFGDKAFNNYVEDIFVGYRYFETFAPEKVLYEFGFGLSYTQFDIKPVNTNQNKESTIVEVAVTNVGKVSGREVVQMYVEAPQGKLGKSKRVLCAFAKTNLLSPGETERITLCADSKNYASYDDVGEICRSSFVLEKGDYHFYVGNSVKKCSPVFCRTVGDDIVLSKHKEVMTVRSRSSFKRFVARYENGKLVLKRETTPHSVRVLKKRIIAGLPTSVRQTEDKGYKLCDVKNGKVSMDQFLAELSLDDLEAITRGEGMMDSAFGPKGNAGIFGGTTESLRAKGIPPMVTTDGPSGIRLLTSCSLLPCGTAIACTWDIGIVEKMFDLMGKEMIEKGTDVLLAPGMNIHRNPLCGRNFEYYSEDPYLTGKMASATVLGIQKNNVSACPKHFACNNQEYNRNHNNSVVTERALREIYLKGFEICVKESKPLNIMTSYNKINGVWSHYNYELCTTVLRDDWGYTGNVMTDWWMRYASSPQFPLLTGNAYRVRSQVDVLMPGAKTAVSKNANNDGTLLESYGNADGITLGEMQRSARNVLNYIINSGKDLN